MTDTKQPRNASGFSADEEFKLGPFSLSLQAKGIRIKQRPVRLNKGIGVVEQKNTTMNSNYESLIIADQEVNRPPL